MKKEIKITCPEGYEIDKENSTFECIKFKKQETLWRYNLQKKIEGYRLEPIYGIVDDEFHNVYPDYIKLFSKRHYARQAQALAQLSQIIENDTKYGGPITEEEWINASHLKWKIIYCTSSNLLYVSCTYTEYGPLTFHTKNQALEFIQDNQDLLMKYFSIN